MNPRVGEARRPQIRRELLTLVADPLCKLSTPSSLSEEASNEA